MAANETIKKQQKKKKWQMPDTYLILFILIVCSAIATYIIPAGEFDRVTEDDITKVIPGTYSNVEPSTTNLMDFFLSFQKGMVEAASLIFLVLFTGGAFAVIEASGAIKAGIKTAIDKTRNKELTLIIVITVLFSLGGSVGIVANSVIAFVPIGIMLARAMKLDAIIGVSIIYLGAYAGFNTGFMNPFTLGIAQQIAELPLYSGIALRIILYIAIILATVAYISWYTKKVLKDPLRSIMGEQRFGDDENGEMNDIKFTLTHKLILLYFILCLGFYIYGTRQFDWEVDEMSAIFVAIAIGAGLIARMGGNEIVKTFIKGAQNLVYGAMIVGVARAIVVLLEEGLILDTIVQAMASSLEGLSTVVGAVGMFLGNAVFNILVPSGSGQAAVAMPIMTPLADMLDIPRQVAVQAFQLGDGFSNSIIPTSGVLMASLAVGKVPYTKWFRFMWPLMLIWIVIGCIGIATGVLIDWGPF